MIKLNKVVIFMEMNNKEIGKRIMRLQKEYGYSQDQLSELLGFSKNHLSGIECGKYTATTPFIFKLCSVLGRTPDYFLIGRVSATTDEITDLVRQLPEDQQELIIKLLKVYLDAQNKSESK